MGNSSSVNKQVSIEIEKLEQLKLNNLSMKKQVATLKEHIEKEGRLIAELREHIDLLKKRPRCIMCEMIEKDTVLV